MTRRQVVAGSVTALLLLVSIVVAPTIVSALYTWEVVGTAGFSAGTAVYTSLAFPTSSSTPYVVYRDGGNSNKAAVMKYDGTNWVSMGFSAGGTTYTSLAFPTSSSTPYVVYRDLNNSNKATAMKFDGTSWVTVGTAGFSAGAASYISLAFPTSSSTPYVVYTDAGNSSKSTVMKFDGTSWVAVGTAGFSAGTAVYTSLAFPTSSSTPYIAYQDAGNSSKSTVMKFDGTSWVAVGTAGFSAGSVSYTSLVFPTSSSTPYLAYQDTGNSSKSTVMKFNGTSWVTVGTAGFSAGAATYTSLAFPTSSSTPYIAYQDASSVKATVMKFDGTSWVTVGTAGFSAGTASYISLAFPTSSSTPYIAYQDGGNSSKTSVMSYAIPDPTYTLSFNTQGGSSVSDMSGKSGGVSVTLPSAPTRSGYIFQNWNTSSAGSDTAYSAGDSYTMPSSDTTLYAIWEADVTAPIISNIASSTTSSTATITWTTNEAGSTKVAYSLDTSYASSTLETDTGVGVTSHSTSITGILSCAMYNFKAVSVDVAGNVATSTARTIITTGCPGGAVPSSSLSTSVAVVAAATSTVTDNGRTLTVATPSNFTATSSSVVIQTKGMSADTVLSSIGKPSSSLNSAASVVFDISALINDNTTLDSFDVPVTVAYTYTDADILGLDENTLAMYHYADGLWTELTDCTIDTDLNSISCTTRHFSVFALFGSNNSSSDSSVAASGGGSLRWCSGPDAPGWNKSLPNGGCSTPAASPDVSPLCPYFGFTRQLRYGSTGEDVRALQKFLNCAGFLLDTSGVGSPGKETPNFSNRTLAAVNAFQRTYTTEVLAPIQSTKPTGVFAQFSQKKVYSLMEPKF